ncbi:MAG: hypothetical protein JWP36_1701 [Paucimonas sp.]|nr:hypothetical protein [Paucimonas sp.]
MSTILDALSRAEHERRLGVVPGLATGIALPTAPPPLVQSGRLRVAVLAASVCVLGLLVFGALWYIRSGEAPASPASLAPPPGPAEPASAGQPVPKLASVQPAASQQVVSEPGAAPRAPAQAEQPRAQAPARPASQPSAGSAGQTASQVVASSAAQPGSQTGARSTARPTNEAAVPPEAAPASERAAPAPTKDAKPAKSTKPAQPLKTARQPQPEAVATAASVPLASALPEGIRQQLPPVSVGGYIFSAIPADRTVLINNKLLHEGENISTDHKLEQLGPDGVVLNYKGHRYRVAY